MRAPKTSLVAAPRCAFVLVQCSEMFMMTSGCSDTETDSAAAPDDDATTEEEEDGPVEAAAVAGAAVASAAVAAAAAEGDVCPAEAVVASSTSMMMVDPLDPLIRFRISVSSDFSSLSTHTHDGL